MNDLDQEAINEEWSNTSKSDWIELHHLANKVEIRAEALDFREEAFNNRVKFLLICTQLSAISTGLFVSAIGFLIVGLLK